MSDEEAIRIARTCRFPTVRIPPIGVINEIVTVNLLDPRRPIVMREPSCNFGPGKPT